MPAYQRQFFRNIRVADALPPVRPRSEGVLERCFQIAEAVHGNATSEYLRCKSHRCKRRITAIRPAKDADFVRQGNATRNGCFGNIHQILVHFAAPFAGAGFDESLSIAGCAPEFGIDDRITPVGQ